MEKELEVVESKSLSAAEIRTQVDLIQAVMKSVMKEGEHYGPIPGCGTKKTLFKPGAEKLLSTFKIAVDPVIEDLSTADEARYRITVRGISQVSGTFLGAGIGECSSNEEKYKWKKAVCVEEWDEAPEDRRRKKWAVNYKTREAYQINQIRTNHSDVANTILKMAKKRGMVDMTLTVTAASDIFTQDIGDPEDLINNGTTEKTSKPETKKPQSKSTVYLENIKMKSKIDGKCSICQNKIKKGEEIYFNTTSKNSAHVGCYNSLIKETTTPTTEIPFGE